MRCFDFVVADDQAPAPEAWRVEVANACRARELAQRILAESPHRSRVEVWEDGCRVFVLPAPTSHAA